MINKEVCKYKEVLLYGVFGAVSTIINVSGFYICRQYLHIALLLSNILAWTAAFVFAFITNKVWVFQSNEWKSRAAVREMASFFIVRLFTLFLDTLLIWWFVEQLQIWEMPAKIFVNMLVIIINYAAGKWWVFKRKNEDGVR